MGKAPNQRTEKTDEEKVKELLSISGHEFHLKIAHFLKKEGWEVTISPYYCDPATDLSREVDIIAKKKFSITEWDGSPLQDLTLRLFIECKYVKDVTLFWLEEKDIQNVQKLIKNTSHQSELTIYDMEGKYHHPPAPHHYLKENKAAKLWQQFNNKGDGTQPDIFYQAMNGCLNSLVFQREHSHIGNYDAVDYPVIVINSLEKIYKRDSIEITGYQRVNDCFQIEVNYSYLNNTGQPSTKYFLLDVVNEDGLPTFLSMLEGLDVKIIAQHIKDRKRAQTQ